MDNSPELDWRVVRGSLDVSRDVVVHRANQMALACGRCMSRNGAWALSVHRSYFILYVSLVGTFENVRVGVDMMKWPDGKAQPYCDISDWHWTGFSALILHAACCAWAFGGLLQLAWALCAGVVMLGSSLHLLMSRNIFRLAASSECYYFNTGFAHFTLFPTATEQRICHCIKALSL